VYNDSGTIDGLMMARNHDAVLVPEGYHPVVSAHGYTTYYLNFLAGSAQSLANTDDPTYAWIKDTWTDQDPRLPVVSMAVEP
jgi:5-deoxy-glucuronate isomerase